MTTILRGFWVDEPFREALREYAWLKRTTMSHVVREVLEHIGKQAPDDSVLSIPDRPGNKRINVKLDDEVWDGAARTATVAGVGFHSLIRRHHIKALVEEGLLE